MPIRRILVVDDSPTERLALTELLTREGYQVLTAENGEQALALARAELPDLVLMDVMMPLMDGLEATRTIRAMQRPDAATIPIVAMTANTFSEDEQRSREAGMNLFLNKPVDSVKMLQTVLECLKMGGENAL